MTLRPPAHCSSPEIAFAERCNEVNLQRQNSSDSLPESNNPFLAMSRTDIKGMEDEVDISSDDSDDDEVYCYFLVLSKVIRGVRGCTSGLKK